LESGAPDELNRRRSITLRTAYVFVLVGEASLKYRVLPLGNAMTVLISSSLIDRQAGTLSGIRSSRLGRNTVEDSKYDEVSVISSESEGD
jgi:hypothetical protein